VTLLLGPVALLVSAFTAPAYCYDGWITGYVRTEHSGATYDGTPIGTAEPIAAAGWDIPIDSVVEVEGAGRYRVADRGRLGPGHIDVAVWTRAEAFELTGIRRVCVYPPP
jgi:3D (Asp-Asp-Asp) domain-containing protein